MPLRPHICGDARPPLLLRAGTRVVLPPFWRWPLWSSEACAQRVRTWGRATASSPLAPTTPALRGRASVGAVRAAWQGVSKLVRHLSVAVGRSDRLSGREPTPLARHWRSAYGRPCLAVAFCRPPTGGRAPSAWSSRSVLRLSSALLAGLPSSRCRHPCCTQFATAFLACSCAAGSP